MALVGVPQTRMAIMLVEAILLTIVIMLALVAVPVMTVMRSGGGDLE